VFTCHFDIDHAIFDTVGTYNFEVYARTTHFTVTDNRLDGSSFTVKVEDKPVTEQEPKVVGLDPAYTVEKGGTLILDFTVEDPLGGVVEKVTVKHNQTGSTCTASLSNNKPGVFTCHFDIDHSIFDKVGTYNFEVYARTTHFTITDNRLKNNSFTVTVTEPACKHLNKTPDTSNEGYTNIILTGATHTFNEKTEYVCDDCGTILTSSAKPIPKTEKHTLIQGKGYCECGHMDVSGNTPEPAYNNTSDTQTVYRTPETKKKDYGSIDGGESVTILGEWGERYLIEYTIDNNGGIKQGWVDKDVITKVKDEEKEEEIPVAKSSFYDINVVEEDSDGDTITFALTSLYPGDLTELIHIPFQGLDNVGYKGIEFGINNKTLGYFYIKEGESVSYCKVEKDAIIYSLGILGGGDGSGLGNSVIGNDGHIWWRESGSQTATKTFYWSVLGELYFKYNHFTKKLSWEKTYANNGEVVDSTFDIAFLVMGVYSFQKNVLGAAIKNVAKEIGKETIEYANKKVLKEIAKEYCKEFVKELGKELLSIPLEQIKEYLEDHYMYFFLPNYEDYTDKAKLFEDIQANKNYKQFLEDYATYGFPRGISLEMFSYEVALLIERAEKAGKTEFSLTKYGPTIELENGLYKKYYDSTITDE